MPISKKSYEILKFISTGNKTHADIEKEFKIKVSSDDTFLKLDSFRLWSYADGGILVLNDDAFVAIEQYEYARTTRHISVATLIATILSIVVSFLIS